MQLAFSLPRHCATFGRDETQSTPVHHFTLQAPWSYDRDHPHRMAHFRQPDPSNQPNCVMRCRAASTFAGICSAQFALTAWRRLRLDMLGLLLLNEGYFESRRILVFIGHCPEFHRITMQSPSPGLAIHGEPHLDESSSMDPLHSNRQGFSYKEREVLDVLFSH